MKVINVTCAIILKDKKILVTQRSERMKLPLKWEFPGGKLEINENEVDCIIREIKEELNIDIEVTGKLTPSIYQYPEFEVNLIPFIAVYKSGLLQLNEHSSFKYLEKNELLQLDWAEADLPIVRELLNIKI